MENSEILRESYEIWRQNPITVELLKNLKKFRESIISNIATNAVNPSMSDAVNRHFGVTLRNTDAITNMITDYEVFSQLVNKK